MGLLKILAFLFLMTGVISVKDPDHFDWRELYAITDVKDQLNYEGSSYFAVLDLITSHFLIHKGLEPDLSAQNAIDCSQGFNNDCFGGGVLNAIDFIRSRGIMHEKEYPYTGILGDCKKNESQSIFKIMGFKILPKDEELMKMLVVGTGPLAVTFKGQNLESYSGGLYNDTDCQSGRSYSGLVIGYGIEDGQDYWIVKMSYGKNWGENGYIKVARNAGNRCGIADYAISLIL